MTNKTDYCTSINDKIDEHFRQENNYRDSDVWVDELIEDDVIALNWSPFIDEYVTYDYVKRVAEFVFDAFPEIHQILSPCGNFERSKC